MDLTLVRDVFSATTTTGPLAVDGAPLYFVLEDVDRKLDLGGVKVKAKSAIPAGRYRVVTTWSKTFKRLMPILQDVPGFQGIRIHSGNKAEDTDGCLLVGTKRSADFVGNSRVACKALYALIAAAEAAGEEVWIDINRAGRTAKP